jgi:signal transduction histidine kinase
MTFSKGIEPRRARVDLVSLLPAATALLCDSAEELGVSLSVVTPDRAVEVTADPALLRTVVSNLVGNALEAAAGRDAGAAPRVEIRLATRGDVAELRVRDTGPGVSDSMRPHLFEPFQTQKPSGVGIGLALSRRIAEAHGGKLVLEGNGVSLAVEDEAGSMPYRGASFLWTLPVESA